MPAMATAEPIAMASKSYDKQTRDGWNLNILLEREFVNSIPNLANARESREGFVTLSATATATGGSSAITDSLFIVGYQLGCQTDVSTGVQLGGAGGLSPIADLGLLDIGVAGGLSGYIQTVLQPGVIVDLPLSNMALNEDGRAMIDLDNIHVKADACGGDVTIRSYGYLRISTEAAHTQFAIYGDPIKI
ncbi:MAG: MspA family porin [Mycolicibacterium sp.]|uniref:MspA family porin n=1 Tax=Mycolicibacterium sp. TaxID=2320850 RepID=UPI003D09E142